MKITCAYDRKAGKPHYLGRPPDLDKHEFGEVFFRPTVVVGRRGSVLKAVGRTLTGRFLTMVFIRRGGDQYHVIAACPSKRKQILLWHREMKKK